MAAVVSSTELDRNDFGANRGRLPWPVQGKVVGNFGRHVHPKYNTVTMNNGIDIAAPHGTPVGAVGDGVTDDRAAFAAADGRQVLVPEGDFRIGGGRTRAVNGSNAAT